jgi:hypothetical protein
MRGPALAIALAAAPVPPALAQDDAAHEGVTRPSLVTAVAPTWPATEPGTREVVVLLEVVVDGSAAWRRRRSSRRGDPFDAARTRDGEGMALRTGARGWAPGGRPYPGSPSLRADGPARAEGAEFPRDLGSAVLRGGAGRARSSPSSARSPTARARPPRPGNPRRVRWRCGRGGASGAERERRPARTRGARAAPITPRAT